MGVQWRRGLVGGGDRGGKGLWLDLRGGCYSVYQGEDDVDVEGERRGMERQLSELELHERRVREFANW